MATANVYSLSIEYVSNTFAHDRRQITDEYSPLRRTTETEQADLYDQWPVYKLGLFLF